MENAFKAYHEIRYDFNSYIPRDNYAELLDLVYYLKKISLAHRFRLPGAQHRARWMSSAIYALKLLLLQSQLDVDAKILNGLELFGYFVAIIYAKHWFKAFVDAEAAAGS